MYMYMYTYAASFTLCIGCCRELWRREAAMDQTIQSARDELTKCERNLRGTMGKVGTVSVVRLVQCTMLSMYVHVRIIHVCDFSTLIISNTPTTNKQRQKTHKCCNVRPCESTLAVLSLYAHICIH